MGRPGRREVRALIDTPDSGEFKTDDDDPRFNNALARGLAILRAFSVDVRLLGTSELTELTGLPKATVSRLTYTLMELGYLRYRENLGKYELAAGVVGLAYPYLANLPITMIARPLMNELALKTKTNVGLAIMDGLSVLYLEYAQGEPRSGKLQRAGYRVPLARTGMGRACLAAMEHGERERLFDNMRAEYGSEWPALRQELEDAIAQIHRHGFCIALGSLAPHANSVAVPFYNAQTGDVMAFNSIASANVQTQAGMAVIGKRLLKMCEEVRVQMAHAAAGPSLIRR